MKKLYGLALTTVLVSILGQGCASTSGSSTPTATPTNTVTPTPAPIVVTITGNVSRSSSTTCSYYIWQGVFQDSLASLPVTGYNWFQSSIAAQSGPFTVAYSEPALLLPGTYYMGWLHASQDCTCGPCSGYNQSIDPWATTSFTVTSSSTTISGVNIYIP